ANLALIEWNKAWKKYLKDINKNNTKLVLRDFHADNLFWLPERNDVKKIGLIDFQDALIGHEAYDISSLLEDVRRDVSDDTKKLALKEFIKINKIKNENKFIKNYKILTAQRNAKIVGIFIRLARRDNKMKYLKLVNKAMNIFLTSAKEAKLDDILLWIDHYIPKNKLFLP
ncbi:MAG: phosphotransferase, partial [Pelagibacterales bacterium]|nr:phosphotransferase [Pelagibacterales bacterium]